MNKIKIFVRLRHELSFCDRLKIIWSLGRKKEICIRPKSLKFPIFLRMDNSDFEVFEQVVYLKQYDFTIFPNPKIILDAGANIGLSAAWFATRFEDAKVIALEPDQENFRVLQKNVKKYKKVKCINKALWYKKTKLQISRGKKSSWAFQAHEQPKTRTNICDSITLHEVIKQTKKIDLFKCDIEGSEQKIFEKVFQ
jgi:FkbM family methyltransferase